MRTTTTQRTVDLDQVAEIAGVGRLTAYAALTPVHRRRVPEHQAAAVDRAFRHLCGQNPPGREPYRSSAYDDRRGEGEFGP